MSEPRRIQLKRTRGWRMPENTVKVTRPGIWGNPFIVNPHVEPGSKSGGAYICVPTVQDAVDCYSEMLRCDGATAEALRKLLPKLRGKNLGCFCDLNSPCHADVLLELANADPHPQQRGEQP